jgi:thioredoxin 2
MDRMAPLEVDDRGILIGCSHCGRKNRLIYERLGDVVRCGACKQTLALVSPLDVGSVADFDLLISRAAIPVVVDFWAPWCGPCRVVAPELVKVAARAAGRFLIVKINTDEVGELGDRYAIRSIPTLAVFAGGREAGRTSGARPADDIEAFVMQTASSAFASKSSH